MRKLSKHTRKAGKVKAVFSKLVLVTLSVIIGIAWTLSYIQYQQALATPLVYERAVQVNETTDTPIKDAREEQGEFTAYSVGDGYTPGETMANGEEVHAGAIACPSRLAIGTRVEVNGKAYTCKDRMAKRFRDGNYFDIYMTDKEQALQFGRQSLSFKIL